MSNDLRDVTNANCGKGSVKYTYFDKDGKIQQGLNPIIDHGFIQVGKVELQPSITYGARFADPCPDCARLKALLADVREYCQPQPDDHHYKGHWELLEVRIEREGIE